MITRNTNSENILHVKEPLGKPRGRERFGRMGHSFPSGNTHSSPCSRLTQKQSSYVQYVSQNGVPASRWSSASNKRTDVTRRTCIVLCARKEASKLGKDASQRVWSLQTRASRLIIARFCYTVGRASA